VAVYAIRYGYKGRAEVRESDGRVKGRALATAGLVLGWLGVAVFTGLFGLELYAHNHVTAEVKDQSEALGTLRTLNAALVTYAATYQNGFPSTLNPLTDPVPGASTGCNNAALIPPSFIASNHSGYTIHYKPLYPDDHRAPAISPKAAAANCISGGASGYTLNADPIDARKRGGTHYYTDQTGIIHYSTDDKPADENSPSLQ
jgi:hypothetical protein